MNLTAHREQARPASSTRPTPVDFGFVNSDMAFQGDYVFVGNFNGFQIYNISNPSAPAHRDRGRLPGRAGRPLRLQEPAVHVGRGDPREEGLQRGDEPDDRQSGSSGVRIFDISNIAMPGAGRAGADVPRLAHPHAGDRQARSPERVHLRPGDGGRPAGDRAGGLRQLPRRTAPVENPSRWRIEVIKVPLAAPQNAAIVNEVRLFSGSAHRRRQRAPERSADHAATRPGIAWGPIADHRRVPRHHRVPGAQDRGRRV